MCAKYIGIDIGGTSVKVGIVNEDGKIIAKDSVATRVDKGVAVIMSDIVSLAKKLLKENGLTQSDITAVGIGCPGTVNSQTGVVTFSGNLKFVNVELVKEFKKLWDIRTQVGNDANCAALGESKFGGGEGSKNCTLMTLGTGVGTGFVVDGKLFDGHLGAGAEGGHIVIRMDGVKCTCGEKGCLEAYASATALIKQTQKCMKTNPESLMHKIAAEAGKVSARTAFPAYKEGDFYAARIVKSYVKFVGAGIVSLINVFRPEVFIIGGGVSNEGEHFIKMLEAHVKKHVFGKSFNKIPEIRQAKLGNDAGVIGAASLVM